MATMFCSKCAADLDAVPVGAPCPGCGGRGRSVRVGVALAAEASLGGIRVLVQQALDELTSMSAEEAGGVVERLVQLSGRVSGKATLSDDLTFAEDEGRHRIGQALPLSARTELGTADGFATYNETIEERAHAEARFGAAVAPRVQRALANPDARTVLLNLASNGL